MAHFLKKFSQTLGMYLLTENTHLLSMGKVLQFAILLFD